MPDRQRAGPYEPVGARLPAIWRAAAAKPDSAEFQPTPRCSPRASAPTSRYPAVVGLSLLRQRAGAARSSEHEYPCRFPRLAAGTILVIPSVPLTPLQHLFQKNCSCAHNQLKSEYRKYSALSRPTAWNARQLLFQDCAQQTFSIRDSR